MSRFSCAFPRILSVNAPWQRPGNKVRISKRSTAFTQEYRIPERKPEVRILSPGAGMRGFRAFPPLLLGVGVGVPGVGVFFDRESIQPGSKDREWPTFQYVLSY